MTLDEWGDRQVRDFLAVLAAAACVLLTVGGVIAVVDMFHVDDYLTVRDVSAAEQYRPGRPINVEPKKWDSRVIIQPKHGWLSETQASYAGTWWYTTPSGAEVEVSEVTEPGELGLFRDAKFRGEVVERLRVGRSGPKGCTDEAVVFSLLGAAAAME